MTASPERRMQLLGTLDVVDRVLTAFYRSLMAIIICAILGIAAWVFVKRPIGAGNQGEYFYFGVAALFGIGCALNQFVLAGRRQRRCSILRINTKPIEGGNAWEFHLGPTGHETSASEMTRFDWTGSLSTPLASLPTEVLPNEQSLDCLQSELARGVDLDMACRMIQPKYENWGPLKRRAFQLYVKSVLAERSQRRASEI